MNNQWATDESRTNLLHAFVEEARRDGELVITSLAELEPAPDPSPAPSPVSDPRNNQAKLCYEKATEIYVEASRSRNTNGLMSTIEHCNEALRILASIPGGGERSLLRDVYNKIILSYSSLENNEKVVELCTLVLRDVDPTDVKTLFKRAIAYEKLGDYKNSLQDLEGVLAVYNDPTSKNYRDVMAVKTRVQNASWRTKWLYTYEDLLDMYYKYYTIRERNTSVINKRLGEVKDNLQSYIEKEDYGSLNYIGSYISVVLNLNQVTLGRNCRPFLLLH